VGDFFKNVEKIRYEGSRSKNPLSFKFYNPDELVMGKKMKEHLKFSVAFWHTINFRGRDMFGLETMERPWELFSDPMDRAFAKIDALFEFCEKLGVEYFTFHDRDIAPEGNNLRETNRNLDKAVERIKENMKFTGIKLLWGTANLFSHPRYAQGAATSPDPDVFAHAAAQVKKALEVTKELGGLGYVFWGGREGYESLLNTDLELELDNLARFLKMAVDYAEKIGFKGVLMIEPKPMEPTKHQYDFDSAHALAFLRKYDLEDYFKFNIEANHATLAGHTFHHELRYARINKKLASIDANKGDLMLGWDTDQFPTDVYETTLAMYEVLKNGGLDCGFNFDAKLRRPSTFLEDLFIAHISGMDAFALGLKIASKLIEDGVIDEFVKERYAKYEEGIGKSIIEGKEDFETLEEYVLEKPYTEIMPRSGKQELLESILNQYIFEMWR